MLAIQEYIKQFKDIATANYFLNQEFSIKISPDYIECANSMTIPVYVYNYDQLNCNKTNPVENDARGLILDMDGDIVSMSFPRFFNNYEGAAAKIDWENATAEIKYDGTLITVYEWRGKYHIQTRGRANADGPLYQANSVSYRDAVETCLIGKLPQHKFDWQFFFQQYMSTFCYVFEYVSPLNRIVTPYEQSDLILLAIIDKHKCIELPRYIVDEYAKENNFKRPEEFVIESAGDMLRRMNMLCDTTDEGFVVVDEDFNRIKLKNPAYVAIARTVNAGGQISLKHFADMAITGEADEIEIFFPEYAPLLRIFNRVLEDSLGEVDLMWRMWHSLTLQKTFAEEVKHHWLSSILFAMRAKLIKTPEEGLKKVKPERLVAEAKKRNNGEVLNRELKTILNSRMGGSK